jgi:UDP-glucose 4-epimerase
LIGREVLVTGGAGFIGSHLVGRLVAEGFNVAVFDSLRTGNLDNIRRPLKESKVRFIRGDIRDYQSIREASEGADTVFHLAGVANVSWSVQNPGPTHEVNATGTLNVLRASVEARVANVIFASSCAVYGNTSGVPLVEEGPTDPVSPYAASKLAAESYLRAFAKTYGLRSTCLRLFNVYGPLQTEGDSGGVIPKFAAALREGLAPVIFGDGEQQRDFVYVGDVVNAFLRALNDGGKTEVYNIGSGNASSINGLFKTLQGILGKEGIQPDYLPASGGDLRMSLASIRKARAELGFEPTVSLEEGLRLTVQERAVYAEK